MEQTARRGALPGFASFNSLFGYLYSMLASTAILNMPVLGGALYMVGRVVILFSRLVRPGDFRRLPRALRAVGLTLGGLSSALAFAVLLVYPLAVDMPGLWLVFALASLVLLMGQAVRLMEMRGRADRVPPVRRSVRQAEIAVLFCAVTALILFVSLDAPTAWTLLGGYALCCVFRLASVRGDTARALPEAQAAKAPPEGDLERLDRVHVYKAFRLITLITVTALQVTVILIYTFIGATSPGLLVSLLIALLCTVLSRWLTDALLARSFSRRRVEPATVLLIGLMLWFLSLVSFALRDFGPTLVWNYVTLALCISGVTMAARALETLGEAMRDIVRFALEREPGQAFAQAQAALSEYASLVGNMVALIGLMLITLVARGNIGPGSVTLAARPILLLPALVLAAAAIPGAFRFPLDSRILHKLRTFLRLKEDGETNIQLQKQLEDLVVRVRRSRYGIKLLILVLRPFFKSEVVGVEKVRPQPGVSCVFTCNHGEMWGPIVSNLFLPFSFRPWVIDEIAEPAEQSDYLLRNTVSRQKWLPNWFKPIAARMTARFLKWVTHNIDSIPVYRDNPKALAQTFRLTAEAMEAGDNILIFPENPHGENGGAAKYATEGVSRFYTGFAMVAQIYHRRTGKRAEFYPVYADKARRQMFIGEPVRFDPGPPSGDEYRRIAAHLRAEMLRMAGLAGDAAAEANGAEAIEAEANGPEAREGTA
ncbi:MAG TPA: 1-acyl-sn-glycerol-3-phosphate acyltransferase [Candidatus Limnocylindria bacterium]|nr:1-acyl-sn-glycerol-3-phosphate acyltransferase [Candidatus Limnocylindria bacterium]